MELRKDLADKYCQCCGRKNIKIWNFLMKQPISKSPNNSTPFRIWNGHKVYGEHDYFYECGIHLEYCTDCGAKLDDEDIKTATESRGEFWGAPCSETIVVGVHCHTCGFDETF